MEFKNSDLYKEIIKSDKFLSVPFYSNSGIIISEDNIQYIIDIEIIKATKNFNLINDVENNINIDSIKEKIIYFYNSNIGNPYLILEFAYFNKDNVDSGVLDIENSDGFYEWLIR